MKGKGAAILLLLLLAGGGVSAARDSVLIVARSEEAQPFVLELQALLAEGVPRIVLTDGRKEILAGYDRSEIDRTFLIEQARAYGMHRVPQPRREAVSSEDAELSVDYLGKGYDPDLLALLDRKEALSWYMDRERVLGIFFIDVTPFGPAKRIRLFLQEGPRSDLQTLHDRLILASEEQAVLEELLARAVRILTADTKGLFKVEGSKELRLSEEAEKLGSLDLYLMATDIRTVTVERNGYEPQTVAVEWEEGITTIRVDLQPIVTDPVILLSSVGAVRYASEDEVGESGMITLGSPSYPIALSVEKEGFVKRVVQIPGEEGRIIRFGVRRAVPDVSDEQKRFYRRVLGTVVSFGSYVTASALRATYDPLRENPLWALALGSTRLLSIVSSVAMVAELSSYASAIGMMQEYGR
ncbi:MAG: hypothetical protein GX911_07855 [Spirochaetales bacterium]|nr:hypothetical protein [Spirochaetales bacterium]